MRNDETGSGAPRIIGEATRAADFGDPFAVDYDERETKLRFQLIPPLRGHRGRRSHNSEIDAAT